MFDKELILQDNVTIHCKTLEESKRLLEWADSEGLYWNDGKSYLTYNPWKDYEEDTCYCIYDGLYAYKQFYEDERFTVLSYGQVRVNNTLSQFYK